MVFPWRHQASECDDCGTRMRFWDFDRRPRYEEFSVIPRHASSALFGAQKNYLWQLRESTAELVRPQSAPDSRSVVRRYAGVPGVRGAPGVLSKLWQSEARGTGVFGGQPLLHQALCLLCGTTVLHGDHQRCGQGTQAGLAHGQGAGQAVHEGAARQGGKTKTESDRHRRDIDSQRTYVSDRGERLGTNSTDLVWRYGPFRTEHEAIL